MKLSKVQGRVLSWLAKGGSIDHIVDADYWYVYRQGEFMPIPRTTVYALNKAEYIALDKSVLTTPLIQEHTITDAGLAAYKEFRAALASKGRTE